MEKNAFTYALPQQYMYEAAVMHAIYDINIIHVA